MTVGPFEYLLLVFLWTSLLSNIHNFFISLESFGGTCYLSHTDEETTGSQSHLQLLTSQHDNNESYLQCNDSHST